MILVMVGSEIRPFTRLMTAVDEIAPCLGEPVIMQSGRAAPFPGRHTQCLGYLTYGHMHRLVSQCRVLVGQGSTGAVLMSRRYGKPLVFVPRDLARGETFDDHQYQTARAMEGRSRMVEVVYDVGGLEAAIRRAQAKADSGLTYEPDENRERLLAAIRAAVEGRELPT